MKKNHLLRLSLITLIALLASCSDDKKEDDNTTGGPEEEITLSGTYIGQLTVTPVGALADQPAVNISNLLVHIEPHPQAQTLQLVIRDFEYESQEYGTISVPSYYEKEANKVKLEAQKTLSIINLGAFEAKLIGGVSNNQLEFDATLSTPPKDQQKAEPRYQLRFDGERTTQTFTNYIFDFEQWGSNGLFPGNEAPYTQPLPEYEGLTWATTDSEVKRLIDRERMTDYTVKPSTEAASERTSAEIRTLEAVGDNLLQIPTVYAGQLYLGTFTDKLTPPHSGIKLGVPFAHKPTTFKGYYKYAPGNTYYACPDPSQPRIVQETDQEDQALIVAYLYEVSSYEADQEIITLDEISSSERVVAEAKRVVTATNTDAFEEFSSNFKWKESHSYDPNKKYRLALYFTASKDGNRFSGAPGSRLLVDYIRILVEQ